jgi:D-alanine-D-alanine ligase
VAVFVPYEMLDGRPVSPDYDSAAYRAELSSWFGTLDVDWSWVPVTMANACQQVAATAANADPGRALAVLNLCDGDEVHGYPGSSVVAALEQAGLPFTGARSAFYQGTTSKADMKERLQAAGVATPPFVRFSGNSADRERLAREVGFPALIKPAVSAASVGISLRSVVFDGDAASAHLARLTQGETGRRYRASGVIAERFVDGPEFTVLLVGDRAEPAGVRAYPAVERIFHSALPPHERFLSYDRYWSLFAEESRVPEGEPFYRYALAADAWQQELTALARRAYTALSGTGYARVDLRADRRTGEAFVLEVNANCGLSGDTGTSVGQILRLTGSAMPALLAQILEDALDRAAPAP